MRAWFLTLTHRTYPPRQRVLALLALAPLFLGVLPWALIRLGTHLDRTVGWQTGGPSIWTGILGTGLTAVGVALALWSNSALFAQGQGTPVPWMATQHLVIHAPYTWCRNPMALGAIHLYLGLAVLSASPGAVMLVAPGAAALLIYIKLVEEKELEWRFGADYVAYRRRTPFLLPRPGRPQ